MGETASNMRTCLVKLPRNRGSSVWNANGFREYISQIAPICPLSLVAKHFLHYRITIGNPTIVGYTHSTITAKIRAATTPTGYTTTRYTDRVTHSVTHTQAQAHHEPTRFR